VGTEHIHDGSMELVRGRDYRIDYDRGEITVVAAVSVGTQLTVAYRHLSPAFSTTYFHREPVRPDSASTATSIKSPSSSSARDASPFGNSLHLGGTKTIGMSFGDGPQGNRMQQSLTLRMSGQVAPDLELAGALSDQDLPLRAEGSTQRLDQLDKVWMELKGRRGRAIAGDYDLSLGGSDWLRQSRQARGIRADAILPKANLTAWGAVAKGIATSQSFSGVEGKQGPYLLRGSRGETTIVIVEGSERVYLNGKLLQGGFDKDYMLSIEEATITFTARVLVTGESRITVDFEYVTDRYRRSFYGVQVESRGETDAPWSAADVRIRTTLLRESDDPERSLDTPLTREMRDTLAAAGDEDSEAWIPGARTVGAGRGSYVAEGQAYRFVGAGKGDLEVRFSYAGEGAGDYVYDASAGGYAYAGAGQGDYVPRVRVALPEQYSFAGLEGILGLGRWGQLQGEIGLSSLDQNALSAIGDGDNRGQSYRLRLNLANPGEPSWTALAASVERSVRERTFRSPGQAQELDFADRWGLAPDSESSATAASEMNVSYHPLQGLDLSAGLGNLATGDEGRSRRNALAVDWTSNLARFSWRQDAIALGGAPSVESSGLRYRRRRDWLAQRDLGSVTPRLLLHEEMEEGIFGAGVTARGWSEFGADVASRRTGSLGVSGGFSARSDRWWQDGTWRKSSETATRKLGLSLRRGSSFQGSLEYANRHRVVMPGMEGISSATDLVGLSLSWAPLEESIWIHTRHGLSGSESSLKEEIYIPVAAGNGDYSRDPVTGRYYQDEHGNYRREIHSRAGGSPVTETQAEIELRCEPARAREQWGSLLRNVSSTTRVSAREKTEVHGRILPVFLHPHTLDDPRTRGGSLVIEQSLRITPWPSKLQVSAHYRRLEDVDRQFLYHQDRHGTDERSARISFDYHEQGSLGLELLVRQEEKTTAWSGLGALRQDRRSVNGTRSACDWRYRLSPEWDVGASLFHTATSYSDPFLGGVGAAARILSVGVEPRVNVNRGNHLRVDAALTIQHGTEQAVPEYWPAEILRGDPLGWSARWNLQGELQLNEWLNASVKYNGRDDILNGMRQTGSVEMRALF
jgi:hypothetical protein